MIERAERLKVIGRAGVGIDNVDLDAATRRGIVVANAPDSTVVSAAEHTIGLLVALARNIPQAHAALKEGRWERSRWGGVELADKTLGVLGFGRIGRQVARRALGLGMRVVGYDPFVAPERFRELGAEHAETVEEVFDAADFLTLHLPLTDDTRGFVGRARRSRRCATASGSSTPPAASSSTSRRSPTAIRSGKVAGAALDVFSAEPYEGELLELENVVTTPHLAASTEEAQDRAGADRRRAGRGGARRRARHERASTSRSSAPRTSRCSARTSRSRPSSAGSRSSSPAASRAGSRSPSTAGSPSTTRAC